MVAERVCPDISCRGHKENIKDVAFFCWNIAKGIKVGGTLIFENLWERKTTVPSNFSSGLALVKEYMCNACNGGFLSQRAKSHCLANAICVSPAGLEGSNMSQSHLLLSPLREVLTAEN